MPNGQDPYVWKLDDAIAIGKWMAATEHWIKVAAQALIAFDIIAIFAIFLYYFK